MTKSGEAIRRLLILAMLLTGCQNYPREERDGIRFNSEGIWDWSLSEQRCNETWHVINKPEDKTSLVFQNATAMEQANGEVSVVYRYEILDTLINGYHLKLESEKRLNAAGEPVSWFLVLSNHNTYQWRRSDWPEYSFTNPIQRCRKATIDDPFVKTNSYSLNPIYAVVTHDHQGFRKDIAECEVNAYGEGVVIEGRGRVSNRAELAKIRNAYSKPIIAKLTAEYQNFDFPSINEMENNTNFIEADAAKIAKHLKRIHSAFEAGPHPEHIRKIFAIDDAYRRCFREERKWQYLRTEWVDTRTGEIIHVAPANKSAQ